MKLLDRRKRIAGDACFNAIVLSCECQSLGRELRMPEDLTAAIALLIVRPVCLR